MDSAPVFAGFGDGWWRLGLRRMRMAMTWYIHVDDGTVDQGSKRERGAGSKNQHVPNTGTGQGSG